MASEWQVKRGEVAHQVAIDRDHGDRIEARIDGVAVAFAIERLPDGRWALRDDAGRRTFHTFRDKDAWVVVADHAEHRFQIDDLRASWIAHGGARRAGSGAIKASMPGRVVRIAVAVGDAVQDGAVVAVLEAMKMENDVRTAVAGTVRAVAARVGDTVETGELLVEIEPAS